MMCPRISMLDKIIHGGKIGEMTSFAPVFSKIVESSLWSEPDYVCKVFVTLLAIKNSDHVARITAYALGRKCWPADLDGAEKRALDALAILGAPDTRRIEPQPYEGRRIQKVEDGWLILNGQAYEDMAREITRKIYKARWERDRRAKEKKQADEGKVSEGYRRLEEKGVKAAVNGDEKILNETLETRLHQ